MPTITADVEVEAKVEFACFCVICGAGMCNNCKGRMPRRGIPYLDIEPCETCLQEARDAAVEEYKQQLVQEAEELREDNEAVRRFKYKIAEDALPEAFHVLDKHGLPLPIGPDHRIVVGERKLDDGVEAGKAPVPGEDFLDGDTGMARPKKMNQGVLRDGVRTDLCSLFDRIDLGFPNVPDDIFRRVQVVDRRILGVRRG